ncbi:MAG: TonB-dependent receptor [Bacteroidales bacterium]|jgi:TonB-linked SusC/RagA family outer membrane protein|nr:TonB-dependent receptor [Bacteroidales bacterium]
MKYFYFFILAGLIHVNAGVLGQRINISLQDATVKQVLAEIEEQCDLVFMYDFTKVDVSKPISIFAEAEPVETVLSQIARTTNSWYEIINRQIVLIPMPSFEKTSGSLQQIQVTGTVTDEEGAPLPGVNIVVKGTSTGVISDAGGNYMIRVDSENAELVYSFVGYITQEIVVADQRQINLTLEEESKQLEEVVVVGYGTQKKINLTGAIASVTGEVLATRPVGAVGTGLQGLLPGVTIVSASGQPGSPGVSILVRGVNTINSSTGPLILIDGVSGGDLNLVNPDDIESVSVLKDAASSAIYGARAANGVIMVTTKRGKKAEKTTFSYSGYFGVQTPVSTPELVNGRQYMTLQNEAYDASGISAPHHEDAFMKYDSKNFPNDYSSTNWVDAIFKKYSTQQNHNFNISGGAEKTSYYMSYGYLEQNGLIVGDPYESTRNNVRLRLNTEVFGRLKLDGNLSYVDFYRQDAGNSGTVGVFRLAQRISPLLPVKWQQPTDDGGWEDSHYWSYGSVANPVRTAYESGYSKRDSRTFNGNFNAVLDLVEGMNVSAQYAYNYYTRDEKTWHPTMPRFAADGTPHPNNETVRNSISETHVSILTQTLGTTVNYEKRIAKNGLKFLAGFSREWAYLPTLSASRNNILLDGVEEINAGTENINNSGRADHWALQSFFGRVNYDYDEKYLFEANIRYDGTSRFSEDNRWGVFPSFSAGWKFSEEGFMDFSKSVLTIGKFRLSWGELGNQTLGSNYYPYLVEIERIDKSYPIGAQQNVGFKQNALANELIQWETIRMFNIGIDLSMLNNRLDATFDWFKKNNINALLTPVYPSLVGVTDAADLPYENMGSIENKGWEVSIGWRDRIGKVHYGLTANLSDAKNKITDLGLSAPSLGDRLRRVGDPIGAYYGYLTDGLGQIGNFESYNETTKKYVNPDFAIMSAYANVIQPGDVKYRDVSGSNGEADGNIDSDDKQVFGDPYPRYSYSLRAYVEWNHFDFSFYLQGVGKVNGYLTEEARHAFTNDYSVPKTAHLDRWTPNNPGATYPRMYYNAAHNILFSDYWLEDASYLRLKNIQLGYTIPKRITEKIGVNRVKVYASIDNLLTITDYFGGFDPEVRETAGDSYPQLKTFAFGLQIGF